MGILALFTQSLQNFLSTRSIGVVVAAGLFSFLVLAVVLNALHQLLVKNPAEPPLVFHWVPFIGNTITYGIDPYKFFFACQEKVTFLCAPPFLQEQTDHIASMVMSLPLFYLGRKRLSAWESRAMISY